MAVAPYRSGQALGWLPGSNLAGAQTIQLNLGVNWYALAFVADATRTLSAVRAFVSAVAGTLASTDITCSLYDSTGTSGAPGASVEAGKLPSATVTAAGWYDFTGFTTALTPGVTYWAVFKNVNAIPATNNCTFRTASVVPGGPLTGSFLSRFAWGNGSSTNSGSTWTTAVNRTGVRISYADGSYDGMPVSNIAAAGIGDGVFATCESGIKFTSPGNVAINVAGLAMYLDVAVGTPTNAFKFGLWFGATPVNQGYTTVVPQTSPGSLQWVYSYFASPIQVLPGTIVRVTMATSGSDTNAKRYLLREVTWDTDSNSVILLPWNGTATKTYYDGTNWTDSALGTSMFGHALLPDTAGEFGVLARTVGLRTGGRM